MEEEGGEDEDDPNADAEKYWIRGREMSLIDDFE
jgi:hypothetical protein